MKKGPLKNLNVYDEAGRAVPVLTRRESQHLAHDILVGLHTGFLEGAEIDGELDRDIWHVIEDAEDRSRPLARKLDLQTEEDGRRTPLGALLEDFAAGFYLYTLIPAKAGDRRVIKFDYEEDHRLIGASRTERTGSDVRTWLGRWARGLAEWMAWLPIPFFVEMPQLAHSSSFHVEVAAPDELFIARSLLNYELAQPRDKISESSLDRTHLYLDRAPRGTRAVLTVWFALEPQGVTSGALFVALLTLGFLISGLVLHFVIHARPGTEAASAVLVAIPGIFASLLFRPGEHRLLRTLVRGIRIQAAALSIVSFTAAGILAVKLNSGLLVQAWIGLTVISSLGFVFAAITYLRCHWLHRQA
jgi:hypothetical protein